MVWSDMILGMIAGAAMATMSSPDAVAQGTTASAAPPHATVAKPPLADGMLDDPCASPQTYDNWAQLCRYHAENARIATGPRPKVVFMGDSITENWIGADPVMFPSGIIDRGISGQTSPQMLLRFYQDVVALHPQVVHIMAGTNDIAGNTGPNSPADFKNNIMAMVTLARANHIGVVLASIPPAFRFYWHPAIVPGPRIVELNAWLKSYAAAVGATYADYHAVLAEPDGRMQQGYSSDGIHPNPFGYQAMRPIALAAIAHALRAAEK